MPERKGQRADVHHKSHFNTVVDEMQQITESLFQSFAQRQEAIEVPGKCKAYSKKVLYGAIRLWK